ncbi:hypothetical protein KQI52_00965 [bacterium]|nr:hypothetical protein [bacterium]
MKSHLSLIVLITMLLLLVSSAHAEHWETITSGWRPEHILVANDDIWASSEGGLLHVDPETQALEVLNIDDGLFSNFLTDIEYDSSTGYLWIGHTNGGIDILDPVDKDVVFTLRDFYNDQSVEGINDIHISNGRIFVGTSQGLSRLERFENEDLWVVLETYRGFASWSRPTEITDIAILDGDVFVASSRGIARADLDANLLDVNVWDIFGNQDILPGIETDGVQFLKVIQGELYFAYYLGDMFKWNGSSFDAFTSTRGIYDLTAMSDGTLYAGRGGGLFSKGPGNSDFGLVNENYTAKFWALAVQDDLVWGAIDTNLEYFGGIVSWDGDNYTYYLPNSPGGDQVLRLDTSPNGDVWLAARSSRIGGVYRLSDGTWYPYAEANNPQGAWGQSTAMTAIDFDAYGGTWIGTWGNGVYYIRPSVEGTDTLIVLDATTSEFSPVGMPPNNYVVVNGFEKDPSGGLWAGNMAAFNDSTLVYIPERWFFQGPDSWDMNDWVRFGPQQGMYSTDVSVMEMDSQGRLWIASLRAEADYPLIMFNPNGTPEYTEDDEFKYYSTGDGADYDHVNDMKMSADGLLWLGTPEGLFYIDTNLPADNVVFTRVYGALGESITALEIDPLDQIWVGTDFGIGVLGRDRFTWIEHYTTEEGAYPSGLVDNQITALTIDSRTGKMYVGTNIGLSVVTTPYRDFADELGDIEVAPQPFLVGKSSDRLRFGSASLVADADIRFFTLSGRLVRTIDFTEASAEGWDGRNEDGEFVGSGVYYVVVTGPDGSSKTGKVAVVRE